MLPAIRNPTKVNGWLVATACLAGLSLFLTVVGVPLWATSALLLVLGFCVGRADSERTMNKQYLQTLEAMATKETMELQILSDSIHRSPHHLARATGGVYLDGWDADGWDDEDDWIIEDE